MKTLRFPTLWLALAVTALLAPTLRTQAAARLLPFQGRLSDANGAAIPDGARVVQFKIYDAPVGGRALWNGEVQKLTVNAGLVSTILGTKATLSGVDFNHDAYLELTIDANADNQITLSDPPLLPRQSILPAVFSYESANARALDGYDWSSLFGTNNPADGTFLDSKIGDSSLTSSKLRDNAITSAKIATGAVTRAKLDATSALPGQSLTYDGSQVVWSQVNAVNAQTLGGFDWSALFTGGNPQSGAMSVASLDSRDDVNVGGNLSVNGRAFLAGPATFIIGELHAPTIAESMYLNHSSIHLRNNGDTNHFLRYGNLYSGQSGFDGPILAGVGGGILGTRNNWSLRWFNDGSVQVHGLIGSASDRNLKENFAAINALEVLRKVLALPITRWNFKEGPKADHIGPVSQDFRAAFGLGSDEVSIATVDADGVALAAIQGLNSKVDEGAVELRALLKTQQEQLEILKAEIVALKTVRK